MESSLAKDTFFFIDTSPLLSSLSLYCRYYCAISLLRRIWSLISPLNSYALLAEILLKKIL
jgi:hypothetical protein